VLIAAFALAACASSAATPAATKPPKPSTGDVLDLGVPATIASLPLVDQDGRRVTLDSLRGKVVVVSPNLTLCQEFCPLISANIGAAVHAVASSGLAAKVAFLEVTVDPDRDDLHHLKAYQELFGAQPNWYFLRGTDAQIAAFWNAFHLAYWKTPDDPGEPQPHDWLTGAPMTYDVDHQNIVYVLGPTGDIDWLVDATPYANGERLPPTISGFLDKSGIKDYTDLPNPDWTAQDLEQAIAYVSGKQVR
jgi:cytochrome oxidase Cu insertion factor (SCO1/SenC/PrrC family)